MSNTRNGMLESAYLIGDLLPIGLSFVVGFIILLIFVVSAGCYGKCRNNGNSLILWLYGGRLTRVEVVNQQNVLYIDGNKIQETGKLRCVRSLLLINAVTLATLLALIFCDAFFVKTDFELGCLVNLDCYIANQNYTKLPINCSDYVIKDEKIACYQFTYDLFQAFADTGGVLSMATLGVVVMTKMWIGCGKSRCTHWCTLITIKIVFYIILIGIVITAVAFIHLHTHESYTFLRDIGHALKFVAVAVSITITTITPWFLLRITQNENEEELPLIGNHEEEEEHIEQRERSRTWP